MVFYLEVRPVERRERCGELRDLGPERLLLGGDGLGRGVGAGAVGHNLTCASRVVFASPCLDTSVRKQAVGRCHRMGQVRPVVVTTLALAGTVEEAALDVMHRDDLPPRFAPNGTELRDQESLRLAAVDLEVMSSRRAWRYACMWCNCNVRRVKQTGFCPCISLVGGTELSTSF